MLTLDNTGSYIENLNQLSNENYILSDSVFLRAYIETLGCCCSLIKTDQVGFYVYDSQIGKHYKIHEIFEPQFTERDIIIYVVSLVDCCRLISGLYENARKVCN